MDPKFINIQNKINPHSAGAKPVSSPPPPPPPQHRPRLSLPPDPPPATPLQLSLSLFLRPAPLAVLRNPAWTAKRLSYRARVVRRIWICLLGDLCSVVANLQQYSAIVPVAM